MSLFQNKFQNAYINTTANASYLITSTFQSDNSLVNKGKSEFEDNVVFDQRVAIGKATDASYALDVSGNVRINGGIVPTLTNDLVFLGNLQATKPVGIGKVYDAGYALDISGNVRITNGNITGGGVVSTSNQNTFTANQTFNNPVGIGKVYDASYSLDVSGNMRIANGNLTGGNVASIKTDNSYDGKQTFNNPVGIGKVYDASYSLDISGNVRITNGNLSGGGIVTVNNQNTFTANQTFSNPVGFGKIYDASYAVDVSGNAKITGNLTAGNLTAGNVPNLNAVNTFTGTSNRFTKVNINRANDSFYTGAMDVSGNARVLNGTMLFTNPPTLQSIQTLTNNAQLTHKYYVDETVNGLKTSNNTWTGEQTFDGDVYLGLATFSQAPIISVVPEQDSEAANKLYVDTVAGGTGLLDLSNVWTEKQTFENNVDFTGFTYVIFGPDVIMQCEGFGSFAGQPPQCNQLATSNAELTNKQYVDTKVSSLLSSNNTWSNFNTFQNDLGIQGNNVTFSVSTATSFLGTSTSFASPPTCVADPVNNNDLCRKSYVDVVFGGNVASLKTNNSYDGKQTFNNAVGIRKPWDNQFSLDVSGNVRISNGNLLVANGTSTFEGNVSMTGTQATVTNYPINDSGIVNRGYADANYARLTINNIYTGNQDWKANNNSFDYPPFCSNGPTDPNHLARKSYVDGVLVNYATSNTTYSGFNNYDPHLPTSLTTPTLPEQFTTKAYVDSVAILEPSYNQLLDYTNQQIDERGLYPLGDDNYRFLSNLTGVVAGNRNSAYGFGAGNGIVSGWNNVCLGYNAGQNVGADTSNCIFLGSNSGALGGTYNNSIAIGSNVSVEGSNQIRIGTTAHTTEIRGEVSLRGQTLYSIVDVSQNITIGTSGYIPYQYFAVDASATITATLGSSSELLGQTATFRRVGGNTTAQVLSASSNIYPLNSFTATNVILDASENLVRITRLRNSAGTAGWYKM
jgi:hypothetical protein